jgi:hypothetical protein
MILKYPSYNARHPGHMDFPISKNKLIVLQFSFLLFFLPQIIFAQIDSEISTKKNIFYVKSIVNQINFGYTRSILPLLSISFEGGYQIRYLTEWEYTGRIIPIEYIYKNLNYSGFTLRLCPNLNFAENWHFSSLVGAQNLFAKKIVYNPGASGGISDAQYKEYSQRIREVIIQLIFSHQLSDIPIQFYFGVGFRFQHLYNVYFIEGTADRKQFSDRKEDYSVTNYPSFIIGLKFIFAWF